MGGEVRKKAVVVGRLESHTELILSGQQRKSVYTCTNTHTLC